MSGVLALEKFEKKTRHIFKKMAKVMDKREEDWDSRPRIIANGKKYVEQIVELIDGVDEYGMNREREIKVLIPDTDLTRETFISWGKVVEGADYI